MAALPEVETYDAGVYQIETTDAVIGGVDGKSNAAARNLANRTKWLKARVDALTAEDTMTTHKAAADPHTGYATKVGLQGAIYNHATAGGTADAITATFTPPITALVDGMTVFVKIGTTNSTTAPTLKVDGTTAETIAKGANLALRMHDLQGIAELKWNATLSKWILQNPDTGTSGLVASRIATVTATGTITTAAAGGTVVVNVATANTQTLPAANALAAGKRIEFLNIGAGAATAARAGTDLLQVNTSTVTSLVLGAGDTLTLETNGISTWYAVGGSAKLGSAAAFKYSRGAGGVAGYTYLPNGMIFQWLSGQTTSGVGDFTFALAFPNVCSSASAIYSGAVFAAGNCVTQMGTWSVTGGRVLFSNAAGGPTLSLSGQVPYYVMAIGY